MCRGLVLALLTIAQIAHADDIHRSDDLFRQGRELLPTNPMRACALFEEAHALNPHSEGVTLNVAQCFEQAGRIAAAYEAYEAAARLSREKMRSCEDCAKHTLEEAEHKIALLVGDVPHL